LIYFLQAIDGGPIKVGQSVNVPSRVRQLESKYGRPLVILGTLPGGRDEERKIHEMFAHLRFGRTEQFRPESDLLAFIGRPLFASAVPVVEPMKDSGDYKGIALVVRGSPEWKVWLERAAEHSRQTVSAFIDHAMAAFAKAQGFPEKPPRR
jgi:hypothetical protein